MKKKTAALLTAKGTNTLTRKNLLRIAGKPLLCYPAAAAAHCRLIDRYYASSDDEEILQEAGNYGFHPIGRPPELSRPDSLHVEALRHALEFMRNRDGYTPEILVVLLANTVYVKASWIEQCILRLYEDSSLSACAPVYVEQDHHPFRAKHLDEDGCLVPYFDFAGKTVSTNRQDLPRNFFFCHNFWVLNVAESIHAPVGHPPWSFMGSRVKPFVIDPGFDVHEEADLLLCERWVENNDVTK